jgi:uncharacterized protein
MGRTFICVLAALGLATASALAAPPAATEITVSGTGSVSLPPNVATVNAAVETNAANANDAVAQNNTIYNRIVTALEQLGVARSDISLAYYNVNYNPRPAVMPPNPDGERYGYTVSRGFMVKVRDIAKAGRVADACTSAGATAINGISFGLSDPSVARTEAATKAVADARSNAEALAHATHLRIVALKSVELGGGLVGPVPLMRAAAAPNAPTEFDQSNVNVTMTVTAVFLAGP